MLKGVWARLRNRLTTKDASTLMIEMTAGYAVKFSPASSTAKPKQPFPTNSKTEDSLV
jgi:hypothetical protein